MYYSCKIKCRKCWKVDGELEYKWKFGEASIRWVVNVKSQGQQVHNNFHYYYFLSTKTWFVYVDAHDIANIYDLDYQVNGSW